MMVVCVSLWLELGLKDFRHEQPVESLCVLVCLLLCYLSGPNSCVHTFMTSFVLAAWVGTSLSHPTVHTSNHSHSHSHPHAHPHPHPHPHTCMYTHTYIKQAHTFKMAPVSSISAMNVLTPRCWQSPAPTRAKMASLVEMRAEVQGTKQPTCAISTHAPTCVCVCVCVCACACVCAFV